MNIPMFIDDVQTMQPDRILLTGDISNALVIGKHLTIMAEQWSDIPIDFVLGNHDYYGESPFVPAKMKSVHKKVSNVVKQFSNLNWLERSGPVKLTDKVALIGSSLWCDWRAGLKDRSSVWLNDYLLIAELFGHPNNYSDRARIKVKVQNLAKDRTNQLINDFEKAIDQGFKRIIVGVHVPPFHEASFYNGKIQDDDWAAHFVCKVAGDKLLAKAKQHPAVDITVLCGHTHGQGKADVLPNLHVINGGAVYRNPAPQTPIILS
jgi:predicted phosphohydrolase